MQARVACEHISVALAAVFADLQLSNNGVSTGLSSEPLVTLTRSNLRDRSGWTGAGIRVNG